MGRNDPGHAATRWSHSPTQTEWPLSVPGVLNLSGRNVPEAEVNLGILNDRYRES